MDTFSLIWSVLIVGGVVALLLIGRFSRRRTTDIGTRGERETLGELNRLEEHDVGEMVEGQNVYRRRRGQRERTESEVRSKIGAEELARLDEADREVKASAR
jgi:hypothetical protein